VKVKNRPVFLVAVLALLGLASVMTILARVNVFSVDTPPDSQRNQIYQTNWNDFETHYAAWLASLNVSRLNLHALQRSDSTAAFAPPQVASLTEAVQSATFVVKVRAMSLRPTTFNGSYVTVSVDATYKGTTPSTIEIHQGGGLRPTRDWKQVLIVDSADAPLLLPGDRAYLFLQQMGSELIIQPFTGFYQLDRGNVSSLIGNPFRADLAKKTEAEMASAIILAARN